MQIFERTQSPIRVNHRGFLKNSAKRFVLVENATQDDTFCVYLVDNVQAIKAFEGKMERVCEGEHTYFTGDFSSITKEGDYFIVAGGAQSRQFVIYDGAYDSCLRTMLGYFTYQRCGHALGWNGACHLDDGYIKETGERVDLRGGYHQSCDLRKSPGGVSIGVLEMLRFAERDTSQWGEILTVDETRFALEYYLKVIQQNGAMYNTLNDPLGWEGRIFYKSPAPSSAQWNVTCALAIGYRLFKGRDDDFATKCLETAHRSWDFLMGEERPRGVYTHPDKYQMGMDPDFFYNQCQKDSVADTAYQIVTASELYRSTDKELYLDVIKERTPKILDALDGFLLKRDLSGRLVSASCSYSWLCGGLFALCDAYELLGDVCGLKNALTSALDSLCAYADKSVWRSVQLLFSNADLDTPCGHENKTRRESMPRLLPYKEYFYSADELFEPSFSCYLGVFLARGARLLESEKYMAYAQSIADSLLGANQLDSSRVHAIGYNQAQFCAYGQFFPSTPFIPGAVGTGYSSVNPSNHHCAEFDMPCVGLSMHLLSLL